jgi:hypothetical protein
VILTIVGLMGAFLLARVVRVAVDAWLGASALLAPQVALARATPRRRA